MSIAGIKKLIPSLNPIGSFSAKKMQKSPVMAKEELKRLEPELEQSQEEAADSASSYRSERRQERRV